ncbi:Por secretion system C-terminal sorting domain-containing protein [Chryseobacterium limigenitum]|uniref:Por secretion system C-terminal sorting domain-containing protein n=2 Tax=Chryseobacterium limigenitum TaxID=1612149 RepID=A0A1K2IS62_9FLAO|nr:Por secretion system C-terminal sorting domain-containing protein [Chryseobacterium limigenitum]
MQNQEILFCMIHKKMNTLKNLATGVMLAGSVVATKAQMALDQTVNGTGEQVYKTITFANGNESNSPSHNFTGPKNIDLATSDSYGGRPSFWRNNGGSGTFVNTTEIGGSTSTTVANEIVGGNTISWNQAQSLQKNISAVSNSLGINFSGMMKRAHADTNADGSIDAKLTTYTLPFGTSAQAAGFQIGDIAIFNTPEIINASTGITLLIQKDSYKVLNNNWEWEDTLNGPTGWSQRNIIDWISTPLSTSEIDAIKTSIYPNPTTDKIFIKLDNPTTKIDEYRIVNTAGELVLEGKDAQGGINVQNLPTGLYILQMSIDGKIITHKVIKK